MVASSALDLREGVPEELLGAGPVLGLHEDAAHKVARVLRDVGRQDGVGGLCGNLKDGRHGLKFSPGGLLSQHLHHSAAQTPVTGETDRQTDRQTDRHCDTYG